MRLVKGLLLGMALAAACVASANTAISTIELTASESSLTLLSSSPGELTYSVELGQLDGLAVSTRAGDFTRLLLPGFHSSKKEGAPELPMLNRLIEIPFGSSARVELLASESRSINLADYGITHPLFPAQPSMPKSADPSTWPFAYDAGSYMGRVAQDLAVVKPLGRLRGVDLGRLEISPVEYFPAENRILVHERIELRVSFDGGDSSAGAELKRVTASPFFTPLYDRIDRTPHDEHPDLVGDVVTMVVVAPPEFEAQLADFVDWKIERGFHTILAITGTPEVGTTKEQIQDYLHDLYLNATEELPAPSFVLFVGDVAQMPTWTLSGDATDRPYCDVEGDEVPDMYYGRFSATNPSQLQAILDKTLMYDQFTMPDPSYLGEVVMIAGMDSGHGSTWGNGQINYGTDYYFNAAHGIYSHTYLYPESGSNSANIIQNVSDGVAYVNYTAHGSQTSWSDPSFTQSDINGLDNYGEYCLAVGNCCLTSTYDYGECFAETWLRAEGKGAIGYIGGSNSTYWDEDYWWGVGAGAIVANPTYEATGLGVYDGLFHDHGEAETQHYVTNDAIIFAGNLAVMEGGSSMVTYYWNIYNLMGDPSLSTYLGVPTENPVTHPGTIFTTWTSFTVEAEPGSYVGLSKDGEVIGAGTVGSDGSLELPIWAQPLMPGAAHLHVTSQHCEPYAVDLNVIVPATVYIDPVSIDAGVETEITVGVFEYDGITPRPGVEVWAEGLDYATTPVMTDATGYCSFMASYPYGPTLDIVGQDPSEAWELFRQPLTVNALPLTGIMMGVTTEIGLSGAFALNLPGTLYAATSGPGGDELPEHLLYAYLNDELVDMTTADSLTLTPDELGFVTGYFAVTGHDLVEADFEVIEAYGTLTGHVDAGGSGANGAILRGYDSAMDLAFEATVNAAGEYDVGQDIVVGPYTITVDYFGYLHWEEAYFLNYGANELDIDLDAAPAGVLTGEVTELDTGLPLAATVKVYRSDTMELYAETATDPFDGIYTTPDLPYFSYIVVVKAWHHIPVTIEIEIEEPITVKDFVLEPTIGDLLIIDDSAKSSERPASIDPKTGINKPSYFSTSAKSAADLVSDLEDLGYTVTMETMSATDPVTWENYDLLLVSSGDNTSTLDDGSFRSALTSFVNTGGHLLVEGGEVGYDYNGSDFGESVLHTADWNHDSSGDVTVADPTHYVMSVPNTITGPISMSYDGWGDADALQPTADAATIGSWTSYPGDASIIVYDPNPAPEGGSFVFFAFNYSAMDAAARPLLLQNAINWLMTPEMGNSSVSGTVTLSGESDHSGVRIEAIPNGGFVYTDVAGSYEIEGLYAGGYEVRASKEGWATAVTDIELADGEHLEGVDFALDPVATEEVCQAPGLPIPDNGSVSDDMLVEIGDFAVSEIAVFVDISHTYIGDLIVTLTSPSGVSVILHDRSGGGSDDLVGWYPGDFNAAGDLADFIGDDISGTWNLHISDNAGADTGTLNEWCLSLTYGYDLTGADHGAPAVMALGANYPNPFNPKTTISFDLPQEGEVDLAVFDVTGRRVVTLAAGLQSAGSHEVAWNGREASGTRAATGVYFYRLEADGKVITRKMVLLK